MITTLPKRVPGLQYDINELQDRVYAFLNERYELRDDDGEKAFVRKEYLTRRIAYYNIEISELMYQQNKANEAHRTHQVIQAAKAQYGDI